MGRTYNSCGIYIIKNLLNNKVYIGQSIKIETRLVNHKSDLKHLKHHNIHLQHSYNKGGVENFSFEILELCGREMLNNREVYWISEYNSTNRQFGYNFESGGNVNKIVSEETREKISKLKKGRSNKNSGNFKKGHEPWNKGQILTNEQKSKNLYFSQKIRENRRTKTTPEMIEDIKNGITRAAFEEKYHHQSVWRRVRKELLNSKQDGQ